MALRTLHLFAGAGGGCLADVLLGHEIVCYVEIDEYCRRVLEQRIRDGLLPDAPIWDDVRTFQAHEWRGKVDVVCGGFPCQTLSVAGSMQPHDNDRNLWPETLDAIRCIRPRWAFLENVPGLLAGSHGYFGEVLQGLADAGYDAEWGVLSAADVGAPHIRKRVWILAIDADRVGVRSEQEPQHGGGGAPKPLDGERETLRHNANRRDGALSGGVSNAERGGLETVRSEVADANNATAQRAGERVTWWDEDPADRPTESGVGRVVDELAHRMDRLRATGNGQVSLVAATAWHLLRGD